MSTVQNTSHTIPEVSFPLVNVLPLENGAHLTREEFERRYEAMPGLKKAELIEGVVFKPSPVRHIQHGRPHGTVIGWVSYYCANTPGLDFGCESSDRLDEDNMPQPDVMLMLPKHAGGTAWIDEDGYIAGAPDLVAEIAASSASIDLHGKLNAYRRNGVREYLVVRTEEQAVDWFEVVNGAFKSMAADEQGRIRSKLFPGLWLDPAALLAGDLPKLFAAVDEGVKTKEHAEFVKKLAAATS
jgi:Uma2 family endonuclease